VGLYKAPNRVLSKVSYAKEIVQSALNSNDIDGCENDSKQDFIAEMEEKGFPEGYIKFLLKLHEKYPNWKFEAVLTNVDYCDFLEYEINNQYKCAEIAAYCTDERFLIEQSSRYYVATSDAIRFFSHPYSMLQTGTGDYENALQFIKADQEISQEYIDKVVPSILRNKDEEVINAIVNSDLCVNPVFVASVYAAEGGPVGEIYEGKEVYNLFNFGADSGRSDARAYAYEQGWFSIEACIEGSDVHFQKFLDRGQDTLYALDWDYASYMKGESLHQYATLVNDAENKAIMMFKRGNDHFDVNQEFILSIPVYNNVPTYEDREYEAFPDPNK